MSLSPENYRGLEVECRELIANAQLLLSGKDSQQHQQAAVFIDEDMYFLHSVHVWVGEQNGETAGIDSRGWLLWDKLSQGAGI